METLHDSGVGGESGVDQSEDMSFLRQVEVEVEVAGQNQSPRPSSGEDKGKGKAQGKGRRQVRRNEAGLPTLPESSISLDSRSGSGSGEGGSEYPEHEHEHEHEGEQGRGYVRSGPWSGSEREFLGLDGGWDRVVAFSGVCAASDGLEEEEGKEEGRGGGGGKEKKTLQTQVSSFFGRKGKGKVEQGKGNPNAKAEAMTWKTRIGWRRG